MKFVGTKNPFQNLFFMCPWQLQHYSDLIICQTYATWSKYYFYEDCWWKSIQQFLFWLCLYLSIWLVTMTTNRHFENSTTKLYLYIRESTIPYNSKNHIISDLMFVSGNFMVWMKEAKNAQQVSFVVWESYIHIHLIWHLIP